MNGQIDIAAWTTTLDGAPSGPDLEYDADFMALDRAVATRGERIVGEGGSMDEPDWDRVLPMAIRLLERSRDLRIAIILCAGWLAQRGLPGWRDGLALVHGMLDTLWESVHPQLDVEDGNDPTSRVNALMPLADPFGMLGRLRTTAFAQSPRLGAYALRDLRLANGTLKTTDPGAVMPSTQEIEACCLDCSLEALAMNVEAVHEALAHARAIDALLDERLSTQAPELKALVTDLFELDRFLQAQWVARTGVLPDEPGNNAADQVSQDSADDKSASSRGGIAGSSDVVGRIEELCAYYAQHEPSSPVPILLRRAQRLVGKNFEEALRDLAPGGLNELQVFSGPESET